MPRQLRPGQRAEIYLLDVTSGHKTLRFSTDSILVEAPNWSPDGRSLIVNGDGHLFRLGVDTGPLEQIDLGDVPDINNDHVLSPDGRFAYVSSDDGHIYAVALTGTDTRRVTNDRGPDFRHYLHGISPDGTLLAYIGMQILDDGVRTNVYTVPAAGGQDIQLTDDDFPDDGAEFSPDGQWIYFNSERASTAPGHAQLFRMPAAGGTIEQLTDDERVNWFPHPAPDGRSLVYVSFPLGTLGHPADKDVIVRLRDEDGTIRDLDHLFGGQGTINVPSWEPNGTRIAFVAYPVDHAA
ncbi:WD40-like Beta Propeller Repeat [Sanguibacter gelidistatuariae]|uniref:WD40-like Beta Propeller Repeat n=1 Tax=Sanguibacter gelidistatuariae TaxID=1814289 RepID=A0A1G6Q5T7_9MICO|nr:TolB family protein [Sanguibacter gelidistatuariae]SDC87678.1 WD40-like Beta Propeller Repeat [Sanguibacter gelidistatuariae]